ncbi:hypothetical protein, partial [Bacillus thuringiensis]|uniref:hypothetical protein n=1 Tax=Bacillus thuringiensis TaxID=1428 RepID=UPI001C3EA300
PPILLKIFRPPTATLASVEVSDMKYKAELAALEPLAIPNKAVPTLVALCIPPKTFLVVLTAILSPIKASVANLVVLWAVLNARNAEAIARICSGLRF